MRTSPWKRANRLKGFQARLNILELAENVAIYLYLYRILSKCYVFFPDSVNHFGHSINTEYLSFARHQDEKKKLPLAQYKLVPKMMHQKRTIWACYGNERDAGLRNHFLWDAWGWKWFYRPAIVLASTRDRKNIEKNLQISIYTASMQF